MSVKLILLIIAGVLCNAFHEYEWLIIGERIDGDGFLHTAFNESVISEKPTEFSIQFYVPNLNVTYVRIDAYPVINFMLLTLYGPLFYIFVCVFT